ncbi:hypothetical protein QQS21_003132 [Conoideocrella luteorostrata]|uniref:LITAF domain-containing protein n=1 Tax=Conoideocrella luteorostrata TaxID=1105319 RepID=A0AAJ0G0T6_9HYPO|nr:hypothetical protein QQS21_003132 [Conoideocrella luteorostrata]
MELGSRDLHATRDRTAQDAATAGWSEEKTVHKSPSAELKEVHTEKQTLASNVDIAKDEGLPEVVPASDNAKAHSNGAATNECTIESESKTVQNPEGDAYQTHKSPPLPDRNARSVPYDPDSVGPSRGPNTSSPIAAQPNNPPGYHHMTGMSPYAKTVTPLNLLADQADLIDCPFCQRRAETTVKTPASLYTQFVAPIPRRTRSHLIRRSGRVIL